MTLVEINNDAEFSIKLDESRMQRNQGSVMLHLPVFEMCKSSKMLLVF